MGHHCSPNGPSNRTLVNVFNSTALIKKNKMKISTVVVYCKRRTSHPRPAYVLTTDDKSPRVFPHETGLYVTWRVELGDNCIQIFLLDRICGRKFCFSATIRQYTTPNTKKKNEYGYPNFNGLLTLFTKCERHQRHITTTLTNHKRSCS